MTHDRAVNIRLKNRGEKTIMAVDSEATPAAFRVTAEPERCLYFPWDEIERVEVELL